MLLTSESIRDCEAKLADFGLAIEANQVSTAARKGTFGYAAPEVFDR